MGARRTARCAIPLVLLGLALTGCTAAPVERGGGSRTTTVTVGFPDRTADLAGVAGQEFLTALADTSGGVLQVRATPRAGQPPAAVLDAVRSGELDAAWLRTDALEAAGARGFAVLQAPFIVTTASAQRAVTGPAVANRVLASLDGLGVLGLALWAGPARHPIATERPLLGPATWTGRRIRSVSPTQSATYDAFGAIPVTVPGDLTQLVPVGTADAAETDLPRQLVAAEFTLAPYLTSDVVLGSRITALVVNPSWFASLDDQARAWVRDAADTARRHALDQDANPARDNAVVLGLCEDGARLHGAGPAAVAELRAAAEPVLGSLRDDPATAPLLAVVESAVGALDPAPATLEVPPWCAGSASPLQSITQVPRTRAPIPPGTYRTHLTAQDIAAAGVGKVQDAQVVTLVIEPDGTYTNSSRFDDDGSVMVFESGEVFGDDETLYFVNDLSRLTDLAERGTSACVWTDPSLGCITNLEPYSVQWRIDPQGLLVLSDPVGVNPDPVMVLTFVANPYRRVG